MRSYLADTYSKARHYLSSFDNHVRVGQAAYSVGSPMLAYAMDAYGASDEAKIKAYMVKQGLEATGRGYRKLKRTARAVDRVASLV